MPAQDARGELVAGQRGADRLDGGLANFSGSAPYFRELASDGPRTP